jgi:hypothetical protein
MADNYKSSYTLKDKQAAIRDALRRMEPVHIHWRMLESLYRTGAQRELTMLDLNRILPFPVPGSFLRTVNMVLPHLTMIINSVVQRDPKFVVTPVGGDVAVVERNAKIANAVLDYFWKRTDATSTLRDMTQDMVILGNGFGKTGWSYSEATVDRTANDMQLETQDIVAAAQEIAMETGAPLTDSAIEEIVSSVALTQQLVEVDEPFLEYVSPYDIFLPANSRRLNTARWVSQRLRISMDDVRNNPLFDKQAVADIKADTSYTDPSTYQNYEQQEEALPEAFTHATVYEFYDMKSRTLCVFQMDSERALYEGPIPYDHRYPPFVHMRNFSDGGNTIWAFGDLENIAGVQLMINEIMHAELNDLKRVGNKYFINKKVVTPELTKALMDNKPDQVIPLDLPNNVSLSEVLQPVQRLATPADNYLMEGKLQDYMQRILGITDFQMGNIGAANRVPGTAAAAVEGAATTRALDKLSNVEKACREVATRMLALCQQFLDSSRAIRIAGPEAPLWLQVTDADIEGEFAVEVEGGSTSAINPATRARQGVEMLQNIVPTLVNLGYNPEPALRQALSYMGLNPDNVLVKAEAPQMPQLPGTTPEMTPEMAQNAPVLPQNPSTEALSEDDIIAQLQAMGGSPMPGAQEGGLL